MKRDTQGNQAYWDKWIQFDEKSILEFKQIILQPSQNPSYEPQFIFEIGKYSYELALRRYSRGDPVIGLLALEDILTLWEESVRLGQDVWTPEQQYTRESWAVNLDNYVVCFWLTGFALAQDVPDEQWKRWVALMGNEGEDALLDRVIASRQPNRKIGDKLCFPKAYKKLLDVVLAPVEQQPGLLRAYLDSWYAGLKNAGHPSFPVSHRTPYWYSFGEGDIEGGAYFGYWCIEAVAVAKAFNIDDTLCLDHPNYPGDLLKDGRSPRYPDPVPEPEALPVKQGWWARLFGSKT